MQELAETEAAGGCIASPRERPILFSGPLVRAILDGRKTQTRRIVTPQPRLQLEDEGDGRWCTYNADEVATTMRCPFGQPGDRLWVRETWGLCSYTDKTEWHDVSVRSANDSILGHWKLEYASDWYNTSQGYWRPSIHMPRWASRITLEVTSVRVERLQEISEDDARAEGVECDSAAAWFDAVGTPDPYATAVANGHRAAFRELWDRINGKRAPWASNPWVWVVGFKVITKEV